MADPEMILIERLTGKVERLEKDAERRDSRASRILGELEQLRRAIDNLRTEVHGNAAAVGSVKAIADKVNRELEAKREDEEAQKRLVHKLAVRAQLVVGVIALVLAMWQGGLKSTFDFVYQLIRDVK